MVLSEMQVHSKGDGNELSKSELHRYIPPTPPALYGLTM